MKAMLSGGSGGGWSRRTIFAAIAGVWAAACKRDERRFRPALTAEEIIACNRKADIFDPTEVEKMLAETRRWQEQKEKEIAKKYAEDLAVGSSGYIHMLYGHGGKVYVNRYSRVYPAPEDDNQLLVRRIAEGFEADCSSDKMTVYLSDKSSTPWDERDGIPVVATFRVKR